MRAFKRNCIVFCEMREWMKEELAPREHASQSDAGIFARKFEAPSHPKALTPTTTALLLLSAATNFV